ncbi:hypothetical protein ELZ88_24490 (plasmid) [Salmonella enterica subsp. enterica serovar Karamoja]|uniref:Uncharacterized protein n=1 Tax=Salmonella enterica subsp. enterica serovar Karamoja TaxID=2500153 RepID=A0A3Q9MLN8_SALET|nr:hypothetical protein [Salmonella enterica]AZT39689.1 hypothetical protein ELZ88_24490 [Salmonella enterica subsp. enterica serovar Karamoja]AZT44411.1 hypothetical protein EL007_24455 [Salmonella enterica subsp. enterica serovar Karamoja]
MFKLKHTALLGLGLISMNSFAGNALSTICKDAQGTMETGQYIQNYTTSTIWPQGSSPSQMAIQIRIDGIWYGSYSKGQTNGGAGYGLSQYVQTMAILHQKVDACVKDGYLIGIENSDAWPIK